MKKQLFLGFALLGSTLQANEDAVKKNEALEVWCQNLGDYTQEEFNIMIKNFEARKKLQDFMLLNPKRSAALEPQFNEFANQLMNNLMKIHNRDVKNELIKAEIILDKYGREIQKSEFSVEEQAQALLELNKILTEQCVECLQKKLHKEEKK